MADANPGGDHQVDTHRADNPTSTPKSDAPKDTSKDAPKK
jgi:hypothetical protein